MAEDDIFQRLSLLDVLSLCNYEVTAVENGRVARDELLKEVIKIILKIVY